MKKYYQYYKYVPMPQIFKNLKFEIGSIGNSRHRRDGFTIVELVIYMGILAFILLMLTDILVAALNVQLATQSTSQVSQDGRYIYNRLIYDINNASSVSAPLNLGSTSATLALSKNSTNYTYALNNGNLQVTTPAGTDQLNSVDTQIADLQFRRIGNVAGKPTFRINFTVIGKIKGTTDSAIFQTTAGLR